MRPRIYDMSTVLWALVFLAPWASANTVTLQNDAGLPGTPCTCFISGEEVGAWLTSPCDGTLTAVEIGWASQFGGAPDSTETAIRVYDGTTFPTPGAVLQNADTSPAQILGPTLSDGGINQFTGFNVPITSGQTVAASLEFFNTNDGNQFAASVVSDGDGCQNGLNAANAIPGGWNDACLLGVPGDWIIRAVVDCDKGIDVPAASDWGLILMALVVLGGGSIAFRRGTAA